MISSVIMILNQLKNMFKGLLFSTVIIANFPSNELEDEDLMNFLDTVRDKDGKPVNSVSTIKQTKGKRSKEAKYEGPLYNQRNPNAESKRIVERSKEARIISEDNRFMVVADPYSSHEVIAVICKENISNASDYPDKTELIRIIKSLLPLDGSEFIITWYQGSPMERRDHGNFTIEIRINRSNPYKGQVYTGSQYSTYIQQQQQLELYKPKPVEYNVKVIGEGQYPISQISSRKGLEDFATKTSSEDQVGFVNKILETGGEHFVLNSSISDPNAEFTVDVQKGKGPAKPRSNFFTQILTRRTKYKTIPIGQDFVGITYNKSKANRKFYLLTKTPFGDFSSFARYANPEMINKFWKAFFEAYSQFKAQMAKSGYNGPISVRIHNHEIITTGRKVTSTQKDVRFSVQFSVKIGPKALSGKVNPGIKPRSTKRIAQVGSRKSFRYI